MADDDFGMLPVASHYQSLKDLHNYQHQVRQISIGAESRTSATFREETSANRNANLAAIELRTKKVLEMYETKLKELTARVEELSHENKVLKRKLFTQASSSKSGSLV